MKTGEYERVCYSTEQRDERVALKNLKTGEIGYSYLCTFAGTTVQVRLQSGELDSWDKADCVEVSEEEAR